MKGDATDMIQQSLKVDDRDLSRSIGIPHMIGHCSSIEV